MGTWDKEKETYFTLAIVVADAIWEAGTRVTVGAEVTGLTTDFDSIDTHVLPEVRRISAALEPPILQVLFPVFC